MAITRRQFVTRVGTLAAAMGASQADLAKVVEAFAHANVTSGVWPGAWTNKPKVVWVHGAECTGCSTSLLSLFQDVRGKAVEGTNISTLAALDLAVGGDGNGGHVAGAATAGVLTITKETDDTLHPYGHRTLFESDVATGSNFESPYVATIADVLIDFIDLQYHETVMGMGGDLAYQWLSDLIADSVKTSGRTSAPFVLVVEGAIQPTDKNGFFNADGDVPWCSIGMGETSGELAFDDVVKKLALHPECLAVIPIGQCACFGGYPACVSPVLKGDMTGAMGTGDFLTACAPTAADKVINVPGCPTNPWWFVLTVVAWLVDFVNAPQNGTGPLKILNRGGSATAISVNPAAVDNTRRLKAVYGTPLHSLCTRAAAHGQGIFAKKPGDPGCLALIGCKGLSTMTLCGAQGWNGQNPRNAEWDANLDYGVGTIQNATGGGRGGNCVAAGHPCMACTEKGYPDAFLPFVVR